MGTKTLGARESSTAEVLTLRITIGGLTSRLVWGVDQENFSAVRRFAGTIDERTRSAMQQFKTKLARDKGAAYGREEVEIIYRAVRTSCKYFGSLERSIRSTVAYSPDVTVPQSASRSKRTNIEVKNETTERRFISPFQNVFHLET